MRSHQFRSVLTPLGLALAASLSCMRATASAEGVPLSSVPTAAPKLVVLIGVDQLRGDMLSRYERDMRRGLRRLMQGAWYVNAYQDHAQTETAPGHASMLSGRFPRSTGIESNSVGVVDPNQRLVVGNGSGASPFRFKGTAVFDWIKAKNPQARAVSVSMKDRSAILMLGQAKEQVYWYSSSGVFTTSTYYRDTLPTWVTAFNARRIPHQYAGKAWTLSRDASVYTEPDSIQWENRGRDMVFPHVFPDDSARAANYVQATPIIDSLTALFALEGLRQTGIGTGTGTDLLAVSFSASDIVGHTWGPDSREAHENQIRLDETIGWFLDSLYRVRDSASIAIVLTADHGVQPIPELARERGIAMGNQGLRVNLRDQVAAVRAGLAAAGADTTAFLYGGDLVAVNRDRLQPSRLKADSILDAFARAVRQVPGVARVDRMTAIRRADFALDNIARRWSHQFPTTSPVELVITLTRYSSWGTGSVATHGSPYDQDAHVPIIFYGPWANPGRYTEFARTVDIAPTLAAMLGITPTETIDGQVLAKAVKR